MYIGDKVFLKILRFHKMLFKTMIPSTFSKFFLSKHIAWKNEQYKIKIQNKWNQIVYGTLLHCIYSLLLPFQNHIGDEMNQKFTKSLFFLKFREIDLILGTFPIFVFCSQNSSDEKISRENFCRRIGPDGVFLRFRINRKITTFFLQFNRKI